MQSRQFLELRQHQQLTLTPQLQQSIRFLQLSTYDLEIEIAQAILENPLLEQQEEYDIDTAQAEPDEADFQAEQWPELPYPNRGGDFTGDAERPEASLDDTLAQHLLHQLHLTRAQPRDQVLVEILINELDENGYLLTPLSDIDACLPAGQAVEPEEWQMALSLLQSFDPLGVGATSLADCLLLQLREWPKGSAQIPPDVLSCARNIAQNHLGILASGNLNRLCEALSCSQQTLRAAHAVLLQLDPRPGRAWATSVADYVIPDVVIRNVKNRWQAFLNPAVMPRLRVNPVYERLLDQSPDRSTLQSHVQQAHGLIKSVTQRFDTVLRVTQSIVSRQQAFFDHGMQAMRPLLLRDIAQELELHESTVSRATRQKFAQTPWGVIELKRFFGAALVGGDGQTTSATAVRSLIIRLVSEEPSKKPLSDSQIAASLATHGVVIARRTVAKYREAAGIEPALLRKARAVLE